MKGKIKKPSKVKFDLSLFQSLVETDLRAYLDPLSIPISDGDSCMEHDVNPMAYFAYRQLEALTKKNVDAPGSSAVSRRSAAMQKFEDAEYQCWLYNRSSVVPHDTLCAEVIGEAKSLARDILGPLRKVDFLKRICAGVVFGPGATFGDSCKNDTSLALKLKGKQTVTKALIPYLPFVARENPRMWELFDLQKVDVVRGNRVTTVPKTAVCDRTIAVEPSFNMLLQRGVDIYLRKRLLRYGVDLSDQTLGWPLAAQGSVDGSYATIDLSSASDLISIRVVREFLPPEWFVFLDDLRSQEYTLDKGKTWRRYEKFSSMGNSFTFPLESLIFYCVAVTCMRYANAFAPVKELEAQGQRCVVYGDDIIVPQRAFCLTLEVLAALGFNTNPDKSFGTNMFRETCGRDFLCGVDVRPVYMQSNPKNEVEVYNLYNRLLNNRQGVIYHRALLYLFRLVSRPFFQPRYWSPGEKWEHWAPFITAVYDAGFMVPRDFADIHCKRVYNQDYQALVYKTRLWRTKQARLQHAWEDILIFLACYTGSHVAYDNGRMYYAQRHVTVTRWHDSGDWPFFLRSIQG